MIWDSTAKRSIHLKNGMLTLPSATCPAGGSSPSTEISMRTRRASISGATRRSVSALIFATDRKRRAGARHRDGASVGEVENEKPPLSGGFLVGWGTWTRTKNKGTRNLRVANYTIPQGCQPKPCRGIKSTRLRRLHPNRHGPSRIPGESRGAPTGLGTRRAHPAGGSTRTCRAAPSTRTAAARCGVRSVRRAAGRMRRAA